MHKLLIALIVIVILLIVFVVCCKQQEAFGKNKIRVITLHYTNWCGYCKQIKPTWQQIKAELSGQPDLKFVENDEDKNPTMGITGYPTILMFNENGKLIKYPGGNDYHKLKTWILAPAH
jgi:thiol-disulfide isomerase/thioredoxin